MPFEYRQLGVLRRVDQSFPGEQDPQSVRFGRSFHYAFDGRRTLAYMTHSGGAIITDARVYPHNDPLRHLEAMSVSNNYDSFVGRLEYLLTRGWQKEQESFAVQRVSEDAVQLLKVSYESTRGGGKSTFDAYVDPQRGYEVVRYHGRLDGTDGRLANETTGQYTVKEIAPGVWRAVAGRREGRSWDRAGALAGHITVVLEPDRIEANTGRVLRSEFFLSAIVPQGQTVNIANVEPQVTYVVGAPELAGVFLDGRPEEAMTRGVPTTQPGQGLSVPNVQNPGGAAAP